MPKELHSRTSGEAGGRAWAENDASARGEGYVSREDCLTYLVDMLDELKAMAGASGLGRLGTMIEIAEEEARRQLRQL